MVKVKVNHNGGYGPYTYEADKVFEVHAGDLADLKKAIGGDITVLEDDKKNHETGKEPVKEEIKEAKPDHDKMVHNEKKEKVVTK